MRDMEMGGRKILITIPEEAYKVLEGMADESGLRVSTFVRADILKMARSGGNTDRDRRQITVDVTNYRELSDYMECKKFGSIGSFATFAMEQYMTKYPAKSKKKEEMEN